METSPPRHARAPILRPEPPPPRRAARLLTAAHDTLGEDGRRFVAALQERARPVATAADLITHFATMVKM